MNPVVLCLANSRLQAETIIMRLGAAGFANADISVLLPDPTATTLFALSRDRDSDLPGARAVGSHGDDVIGGVFGLLAQVGIVNVPGAGRFIAAGSLVNSLHLAAAGSGAGTISDTLVALGVVESAARNYEAELKRGQILVLVNLRPGQDPLEARQVLVHARAAIIGDACGTLAH